MYPVEEWRWVSRFADRLVALRPALWLPTATAIAILSYQRYIDLPPEEAAEKYVEDDAGDDFVR